MSGTAVFSEIGRVNAAEAVQQQLLSLIGSGDLKPGEKLPAEKELARLFGVSRPVVREALGSLRTIGLIVSRNGRGSFVTSPPSRRPPLQGRYTHEDLYDVRSLLEVSNAVLAAERHAAPDAERLGQILEELESCGDQDQWVRLDAKFHVALAQATGNPVRAHLVEQLRGLVAEQSQLMSQIKGRIARANREHRAIYTAIAAGDARAARHAMGVHLRNAHYGR